MTNMRDVVPAVVLAVGIGVIGCGDGKSTKPPSNDGGQLLFTRADSSVIRFQPSTKTYVWCGDWEAEEVPVPSLHIWVGTPGSDQPAWYLRAVSDEVDLERQLPFPNTFLWDEPHGVHIFLLDPPNELGTDTEGSSGWIAFHRLSCAGRVVDFSIDAVLGSELGDMPAVKVRGRFTGSVTGPPPWGLPAEMGFEAVRIVPKRPNQR
jgi:hypothetical protein